MANVTTIVPGSPGLQYIRTCTLLVSNAQGKGLDLSNLRIKFSGKLTNAQTPNSIDIRIYNLETQTALAIQKEFTKVILQAGYQGKGNFGVIFKGTIKQVIIGRESGTDTFVEILASDGDTAYNFAVVNSSIAKGATQQDQVNVCATAMVPHGVTTGGNSTVAATPKLPRGKVFHGNAKNYLRNVAQTTQSAWSIQDEKIVFIPKASYLPGKAVVLNYQTGMIGTPQQTLYGVNVKCLINPLIKIGTRIQLNNDSIQRLALNLNTPASVQGSPNLIPPKSITTDGIYFPFVIDFTGDTRGVEWYYNLVCLTVDPTLPSSQGISASYD